MERKRSALTPENYVKAIISLSKRYASTSAFPGNNYVDIAEWLLQDRNLLNPLKPKDEAVLFASSANEPHDLVVVYHSSERRWDVQQYSQQQHRDFYAAPSVPPGGSGQLVFIRGFISPSWVSVLGSKYSIDPEFFRRHMDFLSASIYRHAYSFPSLASSSDNIFRLCVSTILHRDDFGGQDVRSQRANHAAELATYKVQQLGSAKVCCGDSMVREYSTVCSRFSVIEQWISLCVTRGERGWAVIVWMDQGRPLEKSPPGPWTRHIEAKAISLPVLQHHPKMAFRNTASRLNTNLNTSSEIPLSTAALPLQYETILALVDLARRAPQHTLSMCIPLFAHAAFSEVQFLNLMEDKIQAQIYSMDEGISTDALVTFQYFATVLNRHAQQLRDSIRALNKLAERGNLGSSVARPESPLPSSPAAGMAQRRQVSDLDPDVARSLGSGSGGSGAFTGKGLLEDFEALHVRCIDLSKMCDRGITLAMGKASIEESSKAIEQSRQLKKLTILATLFIPLTFSTSLFGMNVDLLGQSSVRFWWFIVLCIPITSFAYLFYLWDSQAVKKTFISIWRWCGGVRQDIRARQSEKDPTHVV